MPSDPTPPLPLAANRAVLSNRISMLLASQSSVLKSMKLTRPDPSKQQRRRAPGDDNDDDFLRGSRPNEGVGYVPEAKDAGKPGNSREDRMLLRGSKAGRRAEEQRRRKKDESESEDEVGRSALGKRKRPRRERAEQQEEEKGDVEERKEGGERKATAGDDGSVDKSADVDMGDADGDENDTPAMNNSDDKKDDAQVKQVDDGTRKKRKKKNKKKPKSANTQG